LKTKKVNGVDLSSCNFAFVGDESDTSTWKLPIHFPGDDAKTINHILDALARFDTTKAIPECERPSVWFTLYGAAVSHGISVERRTFALHADTPILSAEPQAECAPQKPEPAVTRDLKRVKELEAMADARADELLAAMGFD